jgi:UV DNA damage endonuclease
MNESFRIGYACINNSLAETGVQVNRSMMKRTFLTKGIEQASQLVLKNVTDLAKVIDWNVQNNITLYRMSSDMFPWMSEYEIEDLPDFVLIEKILQQIGDVVRRNNHRLTFHPGPFNVLASPNQTVIDKTLKELRQHGEIMDMLGLPKTAFSKINIHIGGAYGDKSSALERFIKNTAKLAPTVRQRITVENDDKANMFSVSDLMKVHEETEIPIVFDYLHHQFCTGSLSEEEALELALSTWPKDITPIVHYSSAKKQYEDKSALPAAHADFIYLPLKRYHKKIDIMLEAKAKELAIFRYQEDFMNTQVK